ncbi:MAG: hypothetical protein RQ757_03115 [Pseudomonadales bacterium]|nr:hypothetical protein [Pseudomonadales bacterium]
MTLSRYFLPTLLLLPMLMSSSGGLHAHPEPLDENGGHYSNGGTSYHCHERFCQLPDTFDRSGRDSFFYDQSNRERFFNEIDWPVFEGDENNCRGTRHTLLTITSQVTVSFTNPRECEVRTGRWLDEYTGRVFEVATQLALDHIIPLRYAHNHRGDRWPPQKKVAFANDPMNLVLIERREQGRKRDRGPSQYLPRAEYHCSYARQWQAIAEKYELDMANRDRNRINAILEECGEPDNTRRNQPETSADSE